MFWFSSMARRVRPALAVVLLAGCSATSENLSPAIRSNEGNTLAFNNQAKLKDLIYVSQLYMADIWVYRRAGSGQSPFRSVPSCCGNGSIIVHGTDLYVAVNNPPSIQVFHNHSLAPYRTMKCPNTPYDLDIDKEGNAYVVDGNQVLKYVPGSTNGVEIGDPNINFPEYVTVDRSQDVFVAGGTPYNSQEVDWLPAGSNQWKNTGLNFGVLRSDKDGNLVVETGGKAFVVYSVPNFNLVTTFSCPNTGCARFNFTKSGQELWTVDSQPYFGYGLSYVYGIAYPAGTLQDTITEGLVFSLDIEGVALSPGTI